MSPASDASDPRWLFERPPACVIRVRLDGELLACNDAALGLFGAGDRRDVLNTDLTDRIALAQRAQWREFMARCWAEGAGSLECDLVTGTNEARAVLIPGVGANRGGARRWIMLPGFAFQPSELAKLAMVVYLAHSMAKKEQMIRTFSVACCRI